MSATTTPARAREPPRVQTLAAEGSGDRHVAQSRDHHITAAPWRPIVTDMWGQARRERKKPLTHGTRLSVKEKKKRRKIKEMKKKERVGTRSAAQ